MSPIAHRRMLFPRELQPAARRIRLRDRPARRATAARLPRPWSSSASWLSSASLVLLGGFFSAGGCGSCAAADAACANRQGTLARAASTSPSCAPRQSAISTRPRLWRALEPGGGRSPPRGPTRNSSIAAATAGASVTTIATSRRKSRLSAASARLPTTTVSIVDQHDLAVRLQIAELLGRKDFNRHDRRRASHSGAPRDRDPRAWRQSGGCWSARLRSAR